MIIIVIIIVMTPSHDMIGLRRRVAPLRRLSVPAGRPTHPRWRALAGGDEYNHHNHDG